MKGRLGRWVPVVVAACLMVVAVLALRHLLREYRWADILGELRKLTPGQLATALALTAAAYVVLTFYDVLGLWHLGKSRTVPYRRAALASFVGYTFSHNFGFAPLTALPVRYRLYKPAGLSAADVAELFAFIGLTFFVGFLALGGVAFIIEPLPVPRLLHLPVRDLRAVGWLFLGVLAAYVLVAWRVRQPMTVWGRTIHLPRVRIALWQIVVASLDWALAMAVLHAVLDPAGRPSYAHLVGVFTLAWGASVMSHVPGGVGVFETVILFFLGRHLPAKSVAGSLLAYRVVYNLLPLLVALALLGWDEYARRRRRAEGMPPPPAEPAPPDPAPVPLAADSTNPA
jgi:uncharacterized membrane protein YbhN (UPF0104 family)